MPTTYQQLERNYRDVCGDLMRCREENERLKKQNAKYVSLYIGELITTLEDNPWMVEDLSPELKALFLKMMNREDK